MNEQQAMAALRAANPVPHDTPVDLAALRLRVYAKRPDRTIAAVAAPRSLRTWVTAVGSGVTAFLALGFGAPAGLLATGVLTPAPLAASTARAADVAAPAAPAAQAGMAPATTNAMNATAPQALEQTTGLPLWLTLTCLAAGLLVGTLLTRRLLRRP